jgi:hypothetical protein
MSALAAEVPVMPVMPMMQAVRQAKVDDGLPAAPVAGAVDCLTDRVAGLDWPALHDALHARGWATTAALLTAAECAALSGTYAQTAPFRSRVVMARHGFGQGEYKYFAYPLPTAVESLRQSLYPQLAPVANAWHAALGIASRFPPDLPSLLARCHAAGQTRPTPLLLQYGAGDFNCLHQDLYGEHVFPLQVAVLLSEPGRDFEGGEFVLVEQRPRLQSRPHVVPLLQGQAVIFAVHHRPVQGTRGPYRVNLRHGVSTVTAGQRHTLGLIFHDAT